MDEREKTSKRISSAGKNTVIMSISIKLLKKSINLLTLNIHLIIAALIFSSLAHAQTGSNVVSPKYFTRTKINYRITSASLENALSEFASQSDLLLSDIEQLSRAKTSEGLVGQYTPQDALTQLLSGTGLTYQFADGKKIILEKKREVDVLQSIEVIASTIDSVTEGSPSYTVKSTATTFKIPLALRETPQTVTVVPQAIIKDFGLTNIPQIMQFMPGLSMSADSGPQAYYFHSRGNSMQVQYDGVPSSNNFGARGSGMTFDSATIDRVEVLHGASGLLTGPGRPGGTVNIVRKSPTKEAQIAFEVGGDSWGGWRGTADVSGQLGDSGVDGRFIAVEELQDFYIDYTSAKHSVLYGVFGTDIGSATEIYAGVNIEKITDGSYGSHYGLPSNIDGTPLNIPRTKNLGATWNDQDDSLNTIFLRVRHEFSSDWILNGSLTYEDYGTSQLEGMVYREREPELVNKLFFSSNIEKWSSKTNALDLYLTGDFELFDRKHELIAGFNGAWKSERGDGAYTFDPAAEVDIVTWDARKAPSPYALPYGNWSYTGEYKQYGGFVGARFNLADPLHIIAGSRLSWVKQSWNGITATTEDKESTLYGGLVWDLTKNLSVYTSYSDIFEPQQVTVRNRDGAVLDPILGENLEVGLKLVSSDGKLNGALAIFRLDQTNLAMPDYEGVAPNICGTEELGFCMRAAGLVRLDGVELSFSGEISHGWQVYGGYTKFAREYTTPQNENAYAAISPSRFFNLATSYSASDDQWSIGANTRWQENTSYSGELYFMPEQKFRSSQAAYTIFGLFGSYQLTKKLQLSVFVDNLFDKKYFSGLEWPLGGRVYGDARQLSMTLRAEF